MNLIFLDRDGVINKYPGDRDYVKSWEEFSFLPRAQEALKKLNQHGFKIFIVSNQAGIAKGLFSQESLDLINENMLQGLSSAGVEISGVYYCIHLKEEDCSCRKPKTGSIENVLSELKKNKVEVNLKESYFIGDTIVDVQTGKAAGLSTILLFSGKEKLENSENWEAIPDFTAQDLFAAVELILKK